MRPYSSVKTLLCSSNISAFWVLSIRTISGNCTQIPKIIKFTDRQKKIQGISATYLALNETLVLCKSHLRIELYLFKRYSGTRTTWGNLAQIPAVDVLGHMKNNPKSSAPYFTLNEALLFCHDNLRIDLYLHYGYLGIKVI